MAAAAARRGYPRSPACLAGGHRDRRAPPHQRRHLRADALATANAGLRPRAPPPRCKPPGWYAG